jgi:hypothetical protein
MDPQKKELYTAKRSSGVNTSYDPKVQETIQLLLRNTTMDNATNWMLVKVINSNDLTLHASGTNGIRELLDNITDDDVYYGFVKVIHKTTEQLKYFSLYFIGENASGMKKGKSSLCKPAILGIMETNGEIPFNNNMTKADFNYDYIANEVAKLAKTSLDSLIL